MAAYTNPSMLAAAAEPATTTGSLKELREDWITTLDREKMTPWTPAGRPTWRIRLTIRHFSPSLRRSRWSAPSSRIRQRTTRMAERYWEMMVAIATPSTSIPKPTTKTRLSPALTMPAAVR